MLASELQQRLDERWYAEQRELKRRRGRHQTAGRKPNVASLMSNLPPAPSDAEWRRWQETQHWKHDAQVSEGTDRLLAALPMAHTQYQAK